jgi:hypothetical protein
MLLKHPDQYKDEELEAWVRHLVDELVSEGPRLDYKETISLSGEKQKIEAAKDISSFANEVGGTLIYGIPEDRQSDEVAIPHKPYGIDPVLDLESKLENIYVDSIFPRLPEWRIRKVKLTEFGDKVVYIVWTPESWLGPHMIHAYGDKRYYRRGQLRAVPMEEHEVRQRYERLRSLRAATEDFLNSPQLNYVTQFLPENKFASHYLVCPYVLSSERLDFGNTDVRQWLTKNPYGHYGWIPSAQGVRTDFSPSKFDWPCSEIYRNGAISCWRKAAIRPRTELQRDSLLYITEFIEIHKFLNFARGFYELIRYFGPLQFQIRILNQPKSIIWLPREFVDEDLRLLTHDSNLDVRVVVSSGKLFENPNMILKQIGDEIFRAFGLWEADCFDGQFNLIKR